VAVLGLILLAAAGVLTAAVVTSNTDTLAVDLWGVTVSNVTLGVVFVAGMITTVLAVVGLGLLMGGVRRNSRLRKERKSLRRENEQLIQRVESSPTSTEPVSPSDAHYDEPTLVERRHDDRAMADAPVDHRPVDHRPVDHRPVDHQAPVEPVATRSGHDAAGTPVDDNTAPRRRSFLPHRGDRQQPETVSRDV
jgi:hypothetical protein